MPQITPYSGVAPALPHDPPDEQYDGCAHGEIQRNVLCLAAELISRMRQVDVQTQTHEIEPDECLDPELRVLPPSVSACPRLRAQNLIASFHDCSVAPRPRS